MNSTLQKQIESKKQLGAGVLGFSQRELAMCMVITHAALSDEEVRATLDIENALFKTDEAELDEVREKLREFLRT
jgi:hypothetical protein